MGLPTNTSKDLLNLEHKKPASSTSSLESALLVCKKESTSQVSKLNTCDGKIETTSVPKSNVLGKVKDFLGVMAEANERLQLDAKESASKEYDIEALTGNEAEYIEMDLVLGVADLHTPEAVAAAESAMSGAEPVITLAPSSSGSDSESSDDDSDLDDSDDIDSDDAGDGNDKSHSLNKLQEPKSVEGNYLSDSQPKKRQKIIELL